MPAVRIRIVTQKIVQVGDDRTMCGARCQFLHSACCWIDGIEELDTDASGSPLRSTQCLEAGQNET